MTRSMSRHASGGARGEPDGRDHRQPERQGRSKRGSALDPQGFDAGKKVTGRKRHILVDTLGLLLSVSVLPADVQDRDGARDCYIRRAAAFPSSSASSPMPAIKAEDGTDHRRDRDAGSSRSSNATNRIASSFCPSAGSSSARFAWISRNRRLARDFERYARTVAAFVRLAMIRIMLKRLTRPSPCQ